MNRIARVIAALTFIIVAAGCATGTASSAPTMIAPAPDTEPPSTTTTVEETVVSTTTLAPIMTERSTTDQVTSSASQSLEPDCYIGLARAIGWPEKTLVHLAYIIHRESGCDPSAFADRPWTMDLSRGLLQINAYGQLDAGVRRICGIDPASLFDPSTNLECGLQMWRLMGWAPWGG
jgi:hypothetical protein